MINKGGVMRCIGRGMVLFFEVPRMTFVDRILTQEPLYLRRFHTGQWEKLNSRKGVWIMLDDGDVWEYEDLYKGMIKELEEKDDTQNTGV